MSSALPGVVQTLNGLSVAILHEAGLLAAVAAIAKIPLARQS
jgi:hypothetical protein